MVTDKTFVVLGAQPWSEVNPTEVEIFCGYLARANRVLYVNPPSDCNAMLGQGVAISREGSVSQAISSKGRELWVLEPPIILTQVDESLSDRVFDFVNRLNNRRLAMAVLWALRYLGLTAQWLVNVSSVFNGFYLADMLGVEGSVYWLSGHADIACECSRHWQRLEQKLVRRYDSVVACSELLCFNFRQLNSNTFNIGQGFDFENYNINICGERPRQMRDLQRPVIGFVGEITDSNISVDFVEQLATELDYVSVILLSTRGGDVLNGRLARHSNLHVQSLQEGESYAQYICHFDVYVNLEASSSECPYYYPQNVMRALAMGKIVVSMQSQAVECLRYNTLIADSLDEYVGYVELALRNRSGVVLEQRFTDFASMHSWEMVLERFYHILEMFSATDYTVENLQSVEEVVPS